VLVCMLLRALLYVVCNVVSCGFMRCENSAVMCNVMLTVMFTDIYAVIRCDVWSDGLCDLLYDVSCYVCCGV